MRTSQWMILWAALAATGCQNMSNTELAQRDAQTAEAELRLVQGRLSNTHALLNIRPPDSPSHQQLNIQVALLDRQVSALQNRLRAANIVVQQSAANAPVDTANAPVDTANAPVDTANTPVDTANTPVDTANTPNSTVPDAAAVAAALAAAGFGGNTTPGLNKTPSTPAAAVRHWLDELANNRPTALWAALPDNFHQQIEDLISQAAQDIAPDVHSKTFTVAKKANTLLKTKKAMILKMVKTMSGPPAGPPPGLPGQPAIDPSADATLGLPEPVIDPATGVPILGGTVPIPPANGGGPDLEFIKLAEQNWDSITGLLDAVLTSQLADPQWLRNPDLEALLSSKGEDITKHLLDIIDGQVQHEIGMSMRKMLSKLIITETFSGDGKTAKVRVSPPADPNADSNDPEEALELDLEKSSNQWRIAKLGDEFTQSITEAKTELKDTLPPTTGPEKAELLTLLDTIETKLDTLTQAANEIEFRAQIEQFLMGLGANQPVAQPVPAPGPGVFAPPVPGNGPRVDPKTGLPFPSPPRPPNGRPTVPAPTVDPKTGLPFPFPPRPPNGRPAPDLPKAKP